MPGASFGLVGVGPTDLSREVLAPASVAPHAETRPLPAACTCCSTLLLAGLATPPRPAAPRAGDMATWHGPADPLLSSDIPALAATVSSHTHVCLPGEDLGAAMAAAVAAATCSAGSAGGSRVATLVVPHDLSWERREGAAAESLPQACRGCSQPRGPLQPAVQGFVQQAAAALRSCPRGKAALYIGGRAVLSEGVYRGRCRGMACSRATPSNPTPQPAHNQLPAWLSACLTPPTFSAHCLLGITAGMLPRALQLQAARWRAAGASPPPRAPRCCAKTHLPGWTEARACPVPSACPTSLRQGRSSCGAVGLCADRRVVADTGSPIDAAAAEAFSGCTQCCRPARVAGLRRMRRPP